MPKKKIKTTEEKDEWLDMLKEALNDKKMFNVVLITLQHVGSIYCMDCLERIPLSDNYISHTNGHLCGANRITRLISNLMAEKKKRNL